VRGTYSTVTIAVYGYKVDKVIIKEIETELKEQPLQPHLDTAVGPPESDKPIFPENLTRQKLVDDNFGTVSGFW